MNTTNAINFRDVIVTAICSVLLSAASIGGAAAIVNPELPSTPAVMSLA